MVKKKSDVVKTPTAPKATDILCKTCAKAMCRAIQESMAAGSVACVNYEQEK